jgi:hypothetical protein
VNSFQKSSCTMQSTFTVRWPNNFCNSEH